MSDAALVAEELTFEYDAGRALDRASLTAPKGEITALVGPNGAGKTTLMRIVSALMRPQGGRAKVMGRDVAEDPRAVHRLVGYVPDFIGLWDGMTVAQHLDHAGRCAGLSRAAMRERTIEVADQLHIAEKLGSDAAALSRGQRQRVAIAQALVKKPEVLILDEPASGLDPEARKSLSQLMLQLKSSGATLLVSSHILSELDDYSDHVVVIRNGKITRSTSLASPGTTQKIEIAVFGAPNLAEALAKALPGRAARILAPDRAEIELSGGPAEQAEVLAQLVQAGVRVAAFTPRRRSLEDAYFEADVVEASA